MRLLCLDLLLISVIFSDFNRQQKGKISDKDENRSGRRWGYNCSRSSPASYLEAAGTLCEGLFPATPCPGLGQNKPESRGFSGELLGSRFSRGAVTLTDLSVNVQLSLHTQEQEKKALKSRDRQKTKPEGLEVHTLALEGNLLSGKFHSS